ncbi:PREDICTED: B3 domain-containing protein REM10-like [Nicotiana attenuata]|uniref:B3 domain-containing protein REM10-like n=1 Tax=Nicotiana attenuata TaxID=49451 RepID=UPI000904DB5D|nr:PREDICTED: B3 domain-containing protein REM10-like [Nicotiana attenuata]
MEDGWTEFAEEHDLQLGDMLVFRHEGNMEFNVSIFGSSCCEREYAAYMQEDEDEEEETPKKFDLEEKTKANIRTSDKAFPNAEAANKDMHLSHSHLICTIKPYCLTKYFLAIPRQFALKNRLNNRKCMIIIRDERRSWTCSLYTSGENTYIGRGWHEFCTDKCLKEGDRVMFEIVSSGSETPVFEFQDLRGSPSLHPEVKKKNLDVNRIKTTDATSPKVQVPASTSAADTNPHFISTIKPYTIKNPILYLPLAFAKSNGLMNRHCEMILVNEKRRSWSVQLGQMGHHFEIKRGWPEFVQGNGVQVNILVRMPRITPSEAIDKIQKLLVMGKERGTEASEYNVFGFCTCC